MVDVMSELSNRILKMDFEIRLVVSEQTHISYIEHIENFRKPFTALRGRSIVCSNKMTTNQIICE